MEIISPEELSEEMLPEFDLIINKGGAGGTGTEKLALYRYDNYNRLEKLKSGNSTTDYSYNAQGYRVEKKVNSKTTRYLYEYDKVVLETDGSNNQTAVQVYGTNLLYRSTTGEAGNGTQSYYYLYNAHGDVTSLIDMSGSIAVSYDYDAFGNIIGQTGTADNPIRYAGYQYDEESGLYYLNARYYDSVTARFITEDTYTGKKNDPLSLNVYTYCINNPIKYKDPSGHRIETEGSASGKNNTGKNTTKSNTSSSGTKPKTEKSSPTPTPKPTAVPKKATDKVDTKQDNVNPSKKANTTLGSVSAVLGNVSVALGSVKLSNETKVITELSRAQIKSISKLNNTINDHLTTKDFSAVSIELQGGQIGNNGKIYDHIDEMNNSYDALIKARNSLEGSLDNPRLSNELRDTLQAELDKANRYISSIEDLYEQNDQKLGKNSNSSGGGSGENKSEDKFIINESGDTVRVDKNGIYHTGKYDENGIWYDAFKSLVDVNNESTYVIPINPSMPSFAPVTNPIPIFGW